MKETNTPNIKLNRSLKGEYYWNITINLTNDNEQDINKLEHINNVMINKFN